MNHDIHDESLENLLRGLAPAKPTPQLLQRVEEELRLDMSWLANAAPRRRTVRWMAPLGYAAIGAAAAIATMAMLPSLLQKNGAGGTGPAVAAKSTAPATLRDGLMPVSTISELDDIRDEGIHYGSDQMPVKHVLVRGKERHVFIDPRDGAEVMVEYPRQQSLILPVSFQ